MKIRTNNHVNEKNANNELTSVILQQFSLLRDKTTKFRTKRTAVMSILVLPIKIKKNVDITL